MSLRKIVVTLLIAFVGVMFIMNITPTIESEISSTNITNTFTTSMLDMTEWILPVGALVGIFYGIFRLFSGGGKGG